MLQDGTFWLTLLLQCTMIHLKDLAFAGANRASSVDPRLILQEVSRFVFCMIYLVFDLDKDFVTQSCNCCSQLLH
jgi:hypothetical protein